MANTKRDIIQTGPVRTYTRPYRTCSMASLNASSHSAAMCWAASEGNLQAMRQLREEHGANVNVTDYDKR